MGPLPFVSLVAEAERYNGSAVDFLDKCLQGVVLFTSLLALFPLR